jgi:hypothetical protein
MATSKITPHSTTPTASSTLSTSTILNYNGKKYKISLLPSSTKRQLSQYQWKIIADQVQESLFPVLSNTDQYKESLNPSSSKKLTPLIWTYNARSPSVKYLDEKNSSYRHLDLSDEKILNPSDFETFKRASKTVYEMFTPEEPVTERSEEALIEEKKNITYDQIAETGSPLAVLHYELTHNNPVGVETAQSLVSLFAASSTYKDQNFILAANQPPSQIEAYHSLDNIIPATIFKKLDGSEVNTGAIILHLDKASHYVLVLAERNKEDPSKNKLTFFDSLGYSAKEHYKDQFNIEDLYKKVFAVDNVPADGIEDVYVGHEKPDESGLPPLEIQSTSPLNSCLIHCLRTAETYIECKRKESYSTFKSLAKALKEKSKESHFEKYRENLINTLTQRLQTSDQKVLEEAKRREQIPLVPIKKGPSLNDKVIDILDHMQNDQAGLLLILSVIERFNPDLYNNILVEIGKNEGQELPLTATEADYRSHAQKNLFNISAIIISFTLKQYIQERRLVITDSMHHNIEEAIKRHNSCFKRLKDKVDTSSDLIAKLEKIKSLISKLEKERQKQVYHTLGKAVYRKYSRVGSYKFHETIGKELFNNIELGQDYKGHVAGKEDDSHISIEEVWQTFENQLYIKLTDQEKTTLLSV